ncbi:MAG: RIP metalloprotease RseP [Candidatus Marinimicrobia bacterium]|nr:RIP metalloprotease RseP [Candidatus Neomarinimicrobiota bacterium]
MTSLFAFIFIIGILVFIHELGHFMAARSVGVRVEKFYIGFNLFGYGWKKVVNGTEYGIGWFPLGGYVKVAGIIDESMDTTSSGAPDEFRSQPTWAKVWIMSAGVIMNFILAIFLNFVLTFTHGIGEVEPSAIVGTVVPEYPAEALGLQEGDLITAINNKKVDQWTDMTSLIHGHPNTTLKIEWMRDGMTMSDSITTQMGEQMKEGELISVGLIGIGPKINMRDASLGESVKAGFERTGMWVSMMLSTLGGLVTGQVSMDEMGGPVMIAKIAGETASVGFGALIGLMAFLSVNLGLINILPIPGLDGGHVIIALVEGLIGRELSLKVKMGIQQVGILFLLFIFITIMVNDISRLF